MLDNMPKVYIEELNFTDSINTSKVYLCFCNIRDYVFNYETLKGYLHDYELEYFKQLKVEKRMKSFLLGRYVAKKSISSFTSEKDLSNILVTWGIFSQPIVKSDYCKNIQVCITHCDNCGAAIAFPEEYPIGIDLESTYVGAKMIFESYVTDNEKSLMEENSIEKTDALVLLWTAKEALSKALKIGLTSSLELYQTSKIENKDGYFLCKYKNFNQYEAISFKMGEYIFSIAYPNKLTLMEDIFLLRDKLSKL